MSTLYSSVLEWKSKESFERKRRKWSLNNAKRAWDFMWVSLWSFIIISARRHMEWNNASKSKDVKWEEEKNGYVYRIFLHAHTRRKKQRTKNKYLNINEFFFRESKAAKKENYYDILAFMGKVYFHLWARSLFFFLSHRRFCDFKSLTEREIILTQNLFFFHLFVEFSLHRILFTYPQ